MEWDFQKLSREFQKHIIQARGQLNERITESSPEKREVWFSDNGGKTVNRKAILRLVESKNGNKTYVFAYLVG
jgi:hypothetical protein